MRLLVDAHALLWWLGADRRLSANAREAIEAAEDPLVGAGTLMEIAIKRSLGKLEIDEDWPEQTRRDGFGMFAIGWSHVTRLQELPFPEVSGKPHRDPFDRLLAAQALSDGISVVTRDPAIAAYGVAVIW
jgi:PIN domain nuclease of toxin-antitoxin system